MSNDTDQLIVNGYCRSLLKKSEKSITMIGQDIDLLVIMVALSPPENSMVFYRPYLEKCEVQVFEAKTHNHLRENIFREVENRIVKKCEQWRAVWVSKVSVAYSTKFSEKNRNLRNDS